MRYSDGCRYAESHTYDFMMWPDQDFIRKKSRSTLPDSTIFISRPMDRCVESTGSYAGKVFYFEDYPDIEVKLMNDERYDLVFSGDLVAGFDTAQVKKNIQALFRIDDTKVNALFSGKAIPLKKGLDADTANKYRVAMKKAGARVDVVLNRDAAPDPTPASVAATASVGAAVAGEKLSGGQTAVAKASGEKAPQFSTALGAQPIAPVAPRAPIKAPDFGLAAPGGSLLKPEERRQEPAATVDISHLSVAPQQGNLLTEEEMDRPPGVIVTAPDLDIAAAGSDLLLPEERSTPEPVVVDISALTLGKVGERLAPPSAKAPPPPNVDHIKLK